ncbi:hypothetical protein NDU88_006609 [Pleurodeles waltl]|uniref:Uncharacterized protein n=1 Tax=Pleurodeles waltl TaxID=8319 RepID=A0AAV7VQ52_PLEWA|nr:hypothetical protein NDU88_006609 [Pleurodeles waltl]
MNEWGGRGQLVMCTAKKDTVSGAWPRIQRWRTLNHLAPEGQIKIRIRAHAEVVDRGAGPGCCRAPVLALERVAVRARLSRRRRRPAAHPLGRSLRQMAGDLWEAPSGSSRWSDARGPCLDPVGRREWRWAAPGPWRSKDGRLRLGSPGGAVPRGAAVNCFLRSGRGPELCWGQPADVTLGPLIAGLAARP